MLCWILLTLPGVAQTTGASTSSPEFQRKARALQLIWGDVEKHPEGSAERRKFQDEFLTESEAFVKLYPDHGGTWALRGLIAVELKLPEVGWEAGQKLKGLGQENSSKPLFQELFAQLERNKWPGDKSPGAGPTKLKSAKTYENTLGMKFVPVAGTEVLFSVWETRVGDFAAFVVATGYDATAGMLSYRSEFFTEWGKRGDTWKSPGFAQTPNHPVCGVSWEDARKFAAWLTEKERREGRLTAQQSYRLPTDEEWSRAVGLTSESGSTPEARDLGVEGVYPWGVQWPPPRGAGNYDSDSPGKLDTDNFNRTSPAGSFAANPFGLFDLGGNVWEWCEDYYNGSSGSRVVRGGSWYNPVREDLLSSSRYYGAADYRCSLYGFRLVLVGVGVR